MDILYNMEGLLEVGRKRESLLLEDVTDYIHASFADLFRDTLDPNLSKAEKLRRAGVFQGMLEIAEAFQLFSDRGCNDLVSRMKDACMFLTRELAYSFPDC